MADIERLAWFRFFPSDWLGSYAVRRMNATQRGYYIQLLAESWEQTPRSSLPVNQAEIAWMAGAASVEEFTSTGGLYVLAQFVEREGRMWHAKLEREQQASLLHLVVSERGGKQRMASMTDEQRREFSRKGVLARKQQADNKPDNKATNKPDNKATTSPPCPEPEPYTTTPISPKRRRNRTAILAPFPAAVAAVVNALLPQWPGSRKDGSTVKASLPELASRIEECLRQPGISDALLIRAAQDYIASKPDYPHAPQYFFGPGKNGTPPWASYVRMAAHKENQCH